ncbi:hypothetical protein ERJ99_016915 [Pseudomonas aeruginosa]|nr:hypothetical protein ERJ99_016915 [Pseudomonas aeruginosa]
MKDRGGVPPGATMQRGHPSREAAGAGCRGESLVPFGRLQKALAWEGETRGQGRHRKQLDHQT